MPNFGCNVMLIDNDRSDDNHEIHCNRKVIILLYFCLVFFITQLMYDPVYVTNIHTIEKCAKYKIKDVHNMWQTPLARR
jgi:hypothetical protein